MNPNQDDKTTTRHLMITAILFLLLCVVQIVGATIIG